MAYIVPMHVKPKFTYLLTCKQFCLQGSPDLRNLPSTALLSGFQSSWGAVPGEYSLISNRGPVKVENHYEAQN